MVSFCERKKERCADRSHTGPVEEVSLLVAVVVGVEVALPDVVLGVHVVCIDIVAQIDIGEDILELGVVVEGHGSEWVEVVRVNWASLGHIFHLLSLGSSFLFLLVGLVGAEVDAGDGRVDEEVGAPAHAAEGGESVRSGHRC